MRNIIERVTECDSLYGMMYKLASFIFFFVIVRFVLLYVYKIIYRLCNTLVQYKDVHTKANAKDVSFKAKSHR